MKIQEIMESSTQVKIHDGKDYLYWVTQKDEEKAKSAAIKKHKERFGIGTGKKNKSVDNREVSAEIVKKI